MLEKQVLPEEANLIFTAYTNEAIKNEINHLKEENERQAWTYPLFRARKYTTDPNILNTISINNDRISELEAIQSDSL
jgi:hypothetical protein